MKYDEIPTGKTYYTEPVSLTKEEIIDFASQYDPLYFHTDEEAAKDSHFGEIIASGFQTLAVVWRKWVETDVLGKDSVAGLGMDNLRWLHPVKAYDQLTGIFTVKYKKETSNEKHGFITWDVVIKNQEDKEVLTCLVNGLVLK